MSRCSSWGVLAVVAAMLIGPASAQTSVPPDQSAPANVRQSQQYEQVLRSNPSFRAKRVQAECGPITDPELRASCIASFGPEGSPPPPIKPRQR